MLPVIIYERYQELLRCLISYFVLVLLILDCDCFTSVSMVTSVAVSINYTKYEAFSVFLID